MPYSISHLLLLTRPLSGCICIIREYLHQPSSAQIHKLPIKMEVAIIDFIYAFLLCFLKPDVK